jgi:hypothetical protein
MMVSGSCYEISSCVNLMEAVFYRAIIDARGNTHSSYTRRARIWLKGEGLNLATALGLTPEVISEWVRDGCPSYYRKRRKKKNECK